MGTNVNLELRAQLHVGLPKAKIKTRALARSVEPNQKRSPGYSAKFRK